jgi:hypothetical protein
VSEHTCWTEASVCCPDDPSCPWNGTIRDLPAQPQCRGCGRYLSWSAGRLDLRDGRWWAEQGRGRGDERRGGDGVSKRRKHQL